MNGMQKKKNTPCLRKAENGAQNCAVPPIFTHAGLPVAREAASEADGRRGQRPDRANPLWADCVFRSVRRAFSARAIAEALAKA